MFKASTSNNLKQLGDQVKQQTSRLSDTFSTGQSDFKGLAQTKYEQAKDTAQSVVSGLAGTKDQAGRKLEKLPENLNQTVTQNPWVILLAVLLVVVGVGVLFRSQRYK